MDEVLESRRSNWEVGATSFARGVRELDKEDFRSDDRMEDDAEDDINGGFIFEDLGEDRVLKEYGFQEVAKNE